MSNPDFDALLSTTLKNYAPKLEDEIFTARPLFYQLTKADKIKSRNGGAKIVVPLIYALNTTVGSYSGYDAIPTTPQEGISAAEYDWKQFAATIAISGIEEAQNRGKEEVIDLFDAKIMQAKDSMIEHFDYMFFSDGTGNSSKDWLGLGTIVEAADDLGGIPAASTTTDASGASVNWWQPYEENTAGVLTIADMALAYNSVSRGNDHPDTLITTQTLFEKYEALLQPQLRFSDPGTADAGFQNLLYKRAPVMYDDYCTSGVFFFLNSKYLYVVKHSAKWMSQTPFQRPNGQDARYAQILCYGNFVTSNRQRQGKLTGRTA